MNDNRNYIWQDESVIVRPEFKYIEGWIPQCARVIDLGCGNGSLLRILKEKKKIQEKGIELSDSGVEVCKKHKLNVEMGRVDVPLKHIPNDSFDYAVCNVTMQMVMNPEVTIQEMKRIARYQIVSFPNFAFLWQRLELLMKGTMPHKLLYGYHWYNTGHIHQCSIKDFKKMIEDIGLQIKESVFLVGRRKMPVKILPNITATEAIMLLQKMCQ